MRQDLGAEALETDRRVEAVAELGREQALDRLGVLAFPTGAAEAHHRLGHVGGAGVGRHDQDDIAEVDRLAVVVGEFAVVHHLEEDVEHVRMGFLDLVEEAGRRAAAGRPRR